MNLLRRQFLFMALSAAGLQTLSRAARAQTYPARPVRVIVPYAPGGPTDIFGRLIAKQLSERLRGQFYVEDIAGAGGNIGLSHAAKTAPDGYTLVVVPPNIVTNPVLYHNVSYDPYRDFDPVTLAVSSTAVLTINPSLPVQTVNDLVAFVRSNPAKYSFASPGIGTPPHLVGEQFRLALDLDLVHVPFNSAGLAISSTVAGHTPIAFTAVAPAVQQIKDGKLRALAVTTRKRSNALPGIPTMAEAGYPNIEGDTWFAVVVPAGTPKEVIALLNREIVRIVALPDMKDRLETLGFEPIGTTVEECAAQFRLEGDKWTKVIRGAGIRAE
jgi:tripartite-type tricarboxylate transporter receptor subunit TctC